jgi:hypothetical protein
MLASNYSRILAIAAHDIVKMHYFVVFVLISFSIYTLVIEEIELISHNHLIHSIDDLMFLIDHVFIKPLFSIFIFKKTIIDFIS